MIVNPYLLMFLTAVLGCFFTLLGHWIWDRKLRRGTAKLTQEQFEKKCKDSQEKCRNEVMVKLQTQSESLECGDDHFGLIDKKFDALAFVLLKICEKLMIDCEAVAKEMVQKGLME